MAIDEEFVKNYCQRCPFYNDVSQGAPYADVENEAGRTVILKAAEGMIKANMRVCGACGCSLKGMMAAGKACPLGISGKNEGIWAKLKGGSPKGDDDEQR